MKTVVLMTTWNRPTLLSQALPHIEREAAAIAAPFVIADDRSDDEETLALLEEAHNRGAQVIRRQYVRRRDVDVDAIIQHDPQTALRRLLASEHGKAFLNEVDSRAALTSEGWEQVQWLWHRATRRAHGYAQLNNLFAFRHVLNAYPDAELILKVDDDVVLAEGAFPRMIETWDRATRDGHDILMLSGLLSTAEQVLEQLDGYAVTTGAANQAVLYRRSDWELYPERIPERLIVEDGFDCAFLHRYGPAHRPSAVCVTVIPSVAFHTGFNGMHVYNQNMNRNYTGSLDDVIVQ